MKKSRFKLRSCCDKRRKGRRSWRSAEGEDQRGVRFYSWQEVWRAAAVGDETRPDSMSAVPCSVPLAAPSAPPHYGASSG